MGKRGPKPVDMGFLTHWEFAFYKAFHLLRDGVPLPAHDMPPPPGLNPPELRRFIDRLKRMTPEEYCLVSRRVERELGGKVNLRRPPVWAERLWAEQERDEELAWLEQALRPPKLQAQARRREIWNDLVRASTYAALRKVCGRWAQLPDVRFKGMQPYPSHILTNAGAFFLMKRNKRFPRSDYADDARLEYLARGMAGVLVGKSPMTGIERLRNMSHGPRSPLWNESERRCSLSDLWPMVDDENVSLTALRNKIVHGHVFPKTEQWFRMVSAKFHLLWSLERIILKSLRWPTEKSRVSSRSLCGMTLYSEWRVDREFFANLKKKMPPIT